MLPGFLHTEIYVYINKNAKLLANILSCGAHNYLIPSKVNTFFRENPIFHFDLFQRKIEISGSTLRINAEKLLYKDRTHVFD